MCTMTWFYGAQGSQVFFNRDERRTRRPALPPAVHTRGGRRFVAPLDGDFGGSWLAVNECGLTLALHNAYADTSTAPPADGYTSRGLLLTSLIELSTAEDVLERLEQDGLRRFRSFLLTVFPVRELPIVASWIGQRLQVRRHVENALPLVSSAFDSAEVQSRRFELFRRMRQESRVAPFELHLAYHASHLPQRGAYSPCMHRPDACTVSFSRIRVEQEQVLFDYAPHSPCRGLPVGPPGRLPRTPC